MTTASRTSNLTSGRPDPSLYVNDGFPERTSGIVQNSMRAVSSNWHGAPRAAVMAQFLNGADGVAIDSAGNVYVTNLGNHRIEKFTSGSFIMVGAVAALVRGSSVDQR